MAQLKQKREEQSKKQEKFIFQVLQFAIRIGCILVILKAWNYFDNDIQTAIFYLLQLIALLLWRIALTLEYKKEGE